MIKGMDINDKWNKLPTLEELGEMLDNHEEMVVRVDAVEVLLKHLEDMKQELNDYHIRDAELEGWMSMPRNRYLRLLGLELENEELLRRVEMLTEDLLGYEEEEDDRIKEIHVQPPYEIGTDGTSMPSDPMEYVIYTSSPMADSFSASNRPLKWADTLDIPEEEFAEIVREVLRRIDELGNS